MNHRPPSLLLAALLALCVPAACGRNSSSSYGSDSSSSYIDETAIEGSAFGFTIGDGRAACFDAASKAFAGLSVNFRSRTGRRAGDQVRLINMQFQPEELEKIRSLDRWDFAIDGNERNTVKLTFEADTLTKIHRHRQAFELP